MTIFDKIGEAAKNLTEKVSETVEETKISSKINAEKNVIRSLKTDLGEILWEKFQVGEITDPAAVELCEKIKVSLDTIAKHEADIARIKAPDHPKHKEEEKPKCEACGAEVKATAKFCPECGAKIADSECSEMKQCPSCNTMLPADAKFCPECGNNFEQ